MTFDGENVFHCDRNSEQGFIGRSIPRAEFSIRGVGLAKCVRGVVGEEGVNFPVNARNLVKARLHRFARRHFAVRQLSGQFRDGELVEHGY